MNLANYNQRVRQRSPLKYWLGYFSRLRLYLLQEFWRNVARFRGASIGPNAIVCWRLALKANSNLSVGGDTIIDTDSLDLRSPVRIGSHCIINKGVEIIRVSHYIDGNNAFSSRYYPPLVIEDYVWLATGSKILPNCTLVSRGTVLGAFSVCVKNALSGGCTAAFPQKCLELTALFGTNCLCAV